MGSPKVWIISAQRWERALLIGELAERGLDAVGFPEVRLAAAALAHPNLPRPVALLVDLAGTGADPQSLAPVVRARVPVVLLAGAIEAGLPWVAAGSWAAVLRRPLSVGALADALVAQAARAGWRRLG